MPATKEQPDQEKKEEAANLAKEAAEEIRHGNKEEGKFLAEEAKTLDPEAAKSVLKDVEQGGKRWAARPERQSEAAGGELVSGWPPRLPVAKNCIVKT